MSSNIEVEEEDFIDLLELLLEVSLNDLDNFQRELAAGNHREAAMAAHSIKGASGNLGLTDMSLIAAELEKAAKSEDQSRIPEKVALLKQELSRISDALSHKH